MKGRFMKLTRVVLSIGSLVFCTSLMAIPRLAFQDA